LSQKTLNSEKSKKENRYEKTRDQHLDYRGDDGLDHRSLVRCADEGGLLRWRRLLRRRLLPLASSQ
jgi:hypothetical protein